MPQYPANQPVGRAYAHIAGAKTTVLKSSPAVLDSIIVNSMAASGVVTLYDNTTAVSGSVVGVLTFGSAVTDPVVLPYGLATTSALTVVTSGTCDLTVLFN